MGVAEIYKYKNPTLLHKQDIYFPTKVIFFSHCKNLTLLGFIRTELI